jgi:hypothetical protein
MPQHMGMTMPQHMRKDLHDVFGRYLTYLASCRSQGLHFLAAGPDWTQCAL